MKRNILVVDDDTNLRSTLHDLLADAGYSVREAGNAQEALALSEENAPDLVLCDWKMPIAGGEHLLRNSDATAVPIIIMTAHGTGPNAMRAMELGAYDFIAKPLDADSVLAAVQRAIKHADLQREVDELRRQRFYPDADDEWTGRQPKLIGGSPAWLEVFKGIGRVARTDVSVLVLGESGTGKEVVAHAIHENSARRDKPFMVVNCATLPPELMESELFGHERGSFTGAVAQKLGKFEAAAGGTVFLDEIGELPLPLQPKLLRVLQERTFERVGSTKSIAANFRLIAATNRNLDEEVAAKQFRADLYYRLQAFTLQLPPLRERRADILPLAEFFLSRFAARHGSEAQGLTDEASQALLEYPFPGNVRELEHMMDRAAVHAGGRAVTVESLGLGPTAPHEKQSGAAIYEELRALPFHESVAAWERLLITSALAAASGNKSDAARQLGINRRLLYEKLHQMGIE